MDFGENGYELVVKKDVHFFYFQIKAELMFFGAPIKDVRLMRKSSGEIRKK